MLFFSSSRWPLVVSRGMLGALPGPLWLRLSGGIGGTVFVIMVSVINGRKQHRPWGDRSAETLACNGLCAGRPREESKIRYRPHDQPRDAGSGIRQRVGYHLQCPPCPAARLAAVNH